MITMKTGEVVEVAQERIIGSVPCVDLVVVGREQDSHCRLQIGTRYTLMKSELERNQK